MAKYAEAKIVAVAMAGDAKGLSTLVNEGADVNAVDRDGRSPLTNAAISRSLECVRVLITAGARVNLKDKAGWTALHFAAQENAAAIVDELIKAGADIDACDGNGNTALFRAVFSYGGAAEAVTPLLAAGAQPDKENLHGMSPRALADSIANYDVRKFFR